MVSNVPTHRSSSPLCAQPKKASKNNVETRFRFFPESKNHGKRPLRGERWRRGKGGEGEGGAEGTGAGEGVLGGGPGGRTGEGSEHN